MPKLFGAKAYPAFMDVYPEEVFINDFGDEEIMYHYDDPIVFRCDFISLSGHSEKYGKHQYVEESDDIRVEISPDDAEQLTLGTRLGNLRSADGEQYYRWIGQRSDEQTYFAITGMHPRVDGRGRVMFVEALCRFGREVGD